MRTKNNYLHSLELSTIIAEYHLDQLRQMLSNERTWRFDIAHEDMPTVVAATAHFYALVHALAGMRDILAQLINAAAPCEFKKGTVMGQGEVSLEKVKNRLNYNSKLKPAVDDLVSKTEYLRGLVNTLKHRNLVFCQETHALTTGVVLKFLGVDAFTYDGKTYGPMPVLTGAEDLVAKAIHGVEAVLVQMGLTLTPDPKKLLLSHGVGAGCP